MKTNHKKLKLGRTTLRRLNQVDLRQVGGGTDEEGTVRASDARFCTATRGADCQIQGSRDCFL